MRHVVRRSRVHVINKLSREAKKLKGKKGNDEQVVKNQRKAERFIAELLAIKVYTIVFCVGLLCVTRLLSVFTFIFILAETRRRYSYKVRLTKRNTDGHDIEQCGHNHGDQSAGQVGRT